MAEGGYYDRHSRTQGGAAALGLDELRAAAASVPIDGRPVVTVADLGCAQGHNSLLPVGTALAELRRRTGVPVEVVHTDLASNDWATFFEVIDTDPSSYLQGALDVFPSVVGRSFYERLVPPGSLDVAWTASTLHWLSRSPGPIADHFFVQCSTDDGAKDRYRRQAEQDWAAFLGHRSVELRPGGSVVLVDVRMGDDGRMGSEALFDRLEAALRAARDGGRLSSAEYAALAYPTWFRTLAEHRAPFSPGFAGPDDATLELVSLEPVELPDPFLGAFEASGDAAAYGTAQAGFLRGFLEPSFRQALPARNDTDAAALLASVFTDAAHRIAEDPRAVSPTYRLVVGRIARTA